MKKLQNRLQNAKKSLGIGVLVTLYMFMVSGCDLFTYKRSFADAYYNDNFIASIGFDQLAGGTVAPETAITGQWDFAYRYQDWNGFPYMTLSPTNLSTDPGLTASAFGTVSADLSPDAPVYRLELANLLTGGDFEGVTPLSGWVKDADSISVPSSMEILSGGGIHNNSLQFSLLNPSGHFVSYVLPETVQPFIQDAYYRLDFRWKNQEDYVDAERIFIQESSARVTFNKETHMAYAEFAAKPVNTLYFGTAKALNLIIDDITLKKTIPAQLRLLLTRQETSPPLESLLYRFSFWVCEDPSVSELSSPYNLAELRANMQPVTNNSTVGITTKNSRYEYNSDAATHGWKKKSVQVENGNLQFFDSTGLLPVLELIIDLEMTTPGRILIAQPELRCYPDGY